VSETRVKPHVKATQAWQENCRARREAFVSDVRDMLDQGMSEERVADELWLRIGSIASRLRKAGEIELAKRFERADWKYRRSTGWRPPS